MDDFRYDPVWRRIRRDEYANKLEGKFPDRFERLAHLVNWGSLSWLHTHATASKQEHHLGVEHNAMRFLDADEQRAKHRPALRTAAHIMHWGHPPLSYQSAEALLRAAHVEQDIMDTLVAVVDEVVAFGSLDCRNEDHEGRCAAAMLEGERPFEMYRWLAAWLAKEEWSRLWEAISDAEAAAGKSPPDPGKTKKTLARTLVCHEDRGFEVLSACNKADYIPRDLLQCGTAWLSLDPEVLWESDPIGPEEADEWGLIDAALEYLQNRFYSTPDSLLVHTLAARILANSFVSSDFKIDSLRALLLAERGDEHYDKALSPHYRSPFLSLKASARHRLETEWWNVGTFGGVSVPSGTRFQAEDFLTERTGRSRLSFPFSDGHSIHVELPNAEPSDPDFSGEDRRYVTVHCHHRADTGLVKARPLFNVLANIENWIERNQAPRVGSAIVSRILRQPVSQRNRHVEAALSTVAEENGKKIIQCLRELQNRSSFVELRKHFDPAFTVELITETDFGMSLEGSPFLIRLPWRGYKLAPGRDLLGVVRGTAVEHAVQDTGSERGAALELAVAADQLLSDDPSAHRLLVVNAIQWDENRRPVREWDVLRIDLTDDGRWTVTAIECAVNRNKKKDDEAVEKLGVLQEALKGSFVDLADYKTWLATVDQNGELSYEDGGRNYCPG